MNCVVMLCHNSLELTKRAVESVLAQDIPVSLNIIDNGSTDDTWKFISNIDNALPLRYAISRSVAKAWNNSLWYLFNTCDHVLVVNNDVVLRPDTYRELLKDDHLFVTGVGVDSMDAIQGEFVKNIRPHPDFSCFLIRRECWERVGPFDEKFEGAYCEDADYHVRLHQASIEAVSIGMPFHHYGSGTLKLAAPDEADRIRKQADRNREYFERKWGCKVGSDAYYKLFQEVPVGTKES